MVLTHPSLCACDQAGSARAVRSLVSAEAVSRFTASKSPGPPNRRARAARAAPPRPEVPTRRFSVAADRRPIPMRTPSAGQKISAAESRSAFAAPHEAGVRRNAPARFDDVSATVMPHRFGLLAAEVLTQIAIATSPVHVRRYADDEPHRESSSAAPRLAPPGAHQVQRVGLFEAERTRGRRRCAGARDPAYADRFQHPRRRDHIDRASTARIEPADPIRPASSVRSLDLMTVSPGTQPPECLHDLIDLLFLDSANNFHFNLPATTTPSIGQSTQKTPWRRHQQNKSRRNQHPAVSAAFIEALSLRYCWLCREEYRRRVAVRGALRRGRKRDPCTQTGPTSSDVAVK